MKKKRLALLTFCLLFLVVICPLGVSLYISHVRAQKLLSDDVLEFASRTLMRAERVLMQANQALGEIEKSPEEGCSPDHLRSLRRISFTYGYVQEVLYLEGQKVRCSSMRDIVNEIVLPEPDSIGPRGLSVWYQAENDLGINQIMIDLRLGHHAVVIDPASFVDIVPLGDLIKLGVIDLSTHKVISSWPGADSAALSNASKKDQESFVENDRFFAIQRSENFPIAVVAYSPLEQLNIAWQRQLFIWMPFGVLVSGLGATLLLKLLHQHLSPRRQLQEALRLRQFQVHYQPIIDLSNNRCVGAEALMRWQLPDGQYVSPDIFIPMAESFGLIQALTDQLIERVFNDMGAFLAGHPDVHISINLSAPDMQSLRVFKLLEQYLTRFGVSAKQLCIEATERGFIDAELTKPVINTFHHAGHPVHIDDFGTGYSSLSYLEFLKIDAIKIDKSFVDTLATEAAASKVAQHIIEMSHSLGLYMIAEGIENPAQADYLRSRGVQYGQGWLFYRAMPSGEFLNLMSSAQAE
ncbi:EAL domain-containing protein [Pseudomonas atagonensis]|uniref:EAL domain-containing protein n=1 Tax=Pseudomonas atagonensis TaxID=2609964 RepID=UPI00140A5C85|nr:EAL domain-containing protein [Pseudomonas atagonensis]